MSLNDVYKLLPLPFDYDWVFLLPFPFVAMILIGISWGIWGYVAQRSWRRVPSRPILILSLVAIVASAIYMGSVDLRGWMYWSVFLSYSTAMGLVFSMLFRRTVIHAMSFMTLAALLQHQGITIIVGVFART